MVKVKILINSIDRAKQFTRIVSKLDAEMDIICGRYVINAKSIVGIFTIDLSQPVELRIHKDGEDAEKVVEKLGDYLVSEDKICRKAEELTERKVPVN